MADKAVLGVHGEEGEAGCGFTVKDDHDRDGG